MPRRKKKVKEAAEAQDLEKKDVETASSVNVKRKRKLEDAFIVISDSDGEEPKEEIGAQKMKTKQSNRGRCLAKRKKIAQMTEEEQFALAVRMSEQEAREANSQEEEEEALLRKAIEESLSSCQPSDASATRSPPLATGPSSQSHQVKTTDSGTTEGIWQLVPPSLFKGSHISQGNEAEEREEPWDHTENTEEEPVSGSSGSWDQSSQSVVEKENVKCFDRCTGHLAEHTQCGKPQESTGRGCDFHEAAQGRGDTSKHCLLASADAQGLQNRGGTVHYFWGIPFCPAGIDPNQYTKVILCQLEVYQKSLKMAQRQLLKKKGFGEPVLPRPPSLIQNDCGQGDQASENEKNEGISEDTGDEDKEEERQESRASVWHSKPKDFQESPIKSLKEKILLKEEPTTSHESSQGLFAEETSEEGNSVPASQSIAALASKRNLVLMPESSAEEITVCPETQLSSPETFDLEREVSPGSRESLDEVRIIMADKEVGNREDAEKEIPISTFPSSTKVSCPLCDQGFPPTKIERHAMYCNGLVGQDTGLPSGLEATARRKRISTPTPVSTWRKVEAQSKSDSGSAAQTALDVEKNEKCYLCKSLVPFKEYQCHVESCLQLARGDQGDGPAESGRAHLAVEGKQQQWPRNPKEKGRSEGRLLSLLDQSEHKTEDAKIKTKSSETVAFRVPYPGMEEAGCSRDMQSCSLAQLDLTESPIKSFVSISEATDCLVDFKKQFTVRPGSRTRTKAGRGRRRKS